MRIKFVLCVVITILAFCLNWITGSAQRKKSQGPRVSIGGEKTATSCEQVRFEVGDLQIAYSAQETALPGSSITTMQVRAARYGGIDIRGWDQDHYSIKACLAAAGETLNDAQSILAQVSLSVEGNQVTVRGPKESRWMGYLIISAPNGAAMELESEYAPITVSAFQGTVNLRNTYGPVALYEVAGQVNGNIVNGPVTVSGKSGDLKFDIKNGPLTVELTGDHWEAGQLECSTVNGPLTLTLPAQYHSSVQIDSEGRSPVKCGAVQCREAMRMWDNPNRIQFGDSAPVVRLSTKNGPISIKSAE